MIKHAFLMSFALGVALVGFSNSSQAAIVESGSPATFSFDVSGEGALSLGGFNYFCTTSCPANSPNKLAVGASFQLDFGLTAGANDLGTHTFTNPFPFQLDNIANSGISPSVAVPMSASEFFVSVLFVDDIFGIDNFGVGGIGFNLSGVLVDQPSAIPLPAALPLLAGGLGLMGLMGWRRKQAAAA